MNNRNIKYTIEEIKTFVEENSNAELLSDSYKGVKFKLKFRCQCGNEFETTFDNFKHSNKRTCRECSNKKLSKERRFSLKEINEFVNNNSDCILLSKEYINRNQLLLFQCNCGNEFITTFDYFKYSNKRTCDDCTRKRIIENSALSHDQFVLMIYQLYGNEYDILSKYISSSEKIYVRHLCGNEYWAYPGNLLNNHQCIKCYGHEKRSTDQYKKEIFEKYGDEIIVLEDYINSTTRILHKHNTIECGHEWNGAPYDLLIGKSFCPRCSAKIRSEKMRGANSPNWQGGLTSLKFYLRKPMYQWKRDSMELCNYKCVLTDGKFTDVHHLYGYNLIMQEVISELNFELKDTIGEYSQEELNCLVNKTMELHYKYGLGVCLSRPVHKLFHRLYGKMNNTPEQFEEFKTRYNNGEFKDSLST